MKLKTSQAAQRELEMKGKHQALTEELQHLQTLISSDVDVRTDTMRLHEKVQKLSGQVKSLTAMRDDARNKLSKMKENLRQAEDAKRSIESDYKVLVTENRNAANEIKTIKNHMNSNMNAVVDKAIAKDELVSV